jgi:hypothetical protein
MKNKTKKIFGMGTVFLISIILISSATAIPVSQKEAVDNLDQNTKPENNENLVTEDLDGLFDMVTHIDVDIEPYLWKLYNEPYFRSTFTQVKNNIIDKINDTFNEGKEPLVEQLFNLEEGFSFNSLINRINNANYDPEQLAIDVQDMLGVADDLDELEDNYEDEAGLLLDILYRNDGDPAPDGEGLHETIDYICDEIVSIFKCMIEILDPLLGVLGVVTAVVVYIDILLILLFPVIIPLIFLEAVLDAITYDPVLPDELWRLYNENDIYAFIILSTIEVLECIITKGYLWQATTEIGRKILLLDYRVDPSGGATDLKFGETAPVASPTIKAKYIGNWERYKYEFRAAVDDTDKVDGQYRDMVQVGWDFDNDDQVDLWTPLSKEQTITTEYTYPTSGEKIIKYLPKDQWGGVGAWSNSEGFFANHAPNTPTVTGPSTLERFEEGTFPTTTTDIESDNIYFQWKFDSSYTKWEGPYASGKTYNFYKEFATSGTHTVSAKAKDTNGWESDWSDPVEIGVPKNKEKSFILQNLLNIERFPMLTQILQRILQRYTL